MRLKPHDARPKKVARTQLRARSARWKRSGRPCGPVVRRLLNVAAVFAVSLAGCLESGDRAGDAEPVTLAIEPDSARVTGDPVAFTLTLTVREPVTFTHRGCPPGLLDAHVMGESSLPLVRLYHYGEEPMASACATREVTLEPREYVSVVHWNGRIEPQPPEPHVGRVVEGEHDVVARLAATNLNVTASARVTVAPP